MKFTYRGQTYTSSNAPAIDRQTLYTYRGQSYQRSAAIAMVPKTHLVYRGVPYQQVETPAMNLSAAVFSYPKQPHLTLVGQS